MRSARSAIVFLVILTMGLSLSVLPEDVAETAFDESEEQPYERTPLFPIVLRPVIARTAKDRLTRVSALSGGSLTEHCAFCPEHKASSPHTVSDSLTTLNHSFRC